VTEQPAAAAAAAAATDGAAAPLTALQQLADCLMGLALLAAAVDPAEVFAAIAMNHRLQQQQPAPKDHWQVLVILPMARGGGSLVTVNTCVCHVGVWGGGGYQGLLVAALCVTDLCLVSHWNWNSICLTVGLDFCLDFVDLLAQKTGRG
jgi:hypothetical protein